MSLRMVFVRGVEPIVLVDGEFSSSHVVDMIA